MFSKENHGMLFRLTPPLLEFLIPSSMKMVEMLT